MDGKQFYLHETSTAEMLRLLLNEMLAGKIAAFPA
jgi:hypothetical protein